MFSINDNTDIEYLCGKHQGPLLQPWINVDPRMDK